MSKKSGCPRGSHRVKGRCRSVKEICYKGRCGNPVFHEGKDGRIYIMVRKKYGGTKRLYLDPNLNVPKRYRGIKW
jgi:hypothetical protein